MREEAEGETPRRGRLRLQERQERLQARHGRPREVNSVAKDREGYL